MFEKKIQSVIVNMINQGDPPDELTDSAAMNSSLWLSIDEDIARLKEENRLLQAQAEEDRREIKYLRSMFAQKYNYAEIKTRLDPIRDELKMTQRIFSRIIKGRYAAPVAIAVSLSDSDYYISPTWNAQK